MHTFPFKSWKTPLPKMESGTPLDILSEAAYVIQTAENEKEYQDGMAKLEAKNPGALAALGLSVPAAKPPNHYRKPRTYSGARAIRLKRPRRVRLQRSPFRAFTTH